MSDIFEIYYPTWDDLRADIVFGHTGTGSLDAHVT